MFGMFDIYLVVDDYSVLSKDHNPNWVGVLLLKRKATGKKNVHLLNHFVKQVASDKPVVSS
jgi:hypothetical protein